jgi:uncharacterized protein YkwD
MAYWRAALISASWMSAALLLVGLALAATVTHAGAGGEATTSGRTASRRGRYHFRSTERCFLREINDRRASRGLHRLRWDKQIGYVARRHARAMARATRVVHDNRLGSEVTHWRSLGQNTGGGHRCHSLFRGFWRSDGHRRNILGRWRFIGVGVKWRDGRVYVQQVFEYRSDPGNVFGYP